jgi:hypothetical protein
MDNCCDGGGGENGQQVNESGIIRGNKDVKEHYYLLGYNAV